MHVSDRYTQRGEIFDLLACRARESRHQIAFGRIVVVLARRDLHIDLHIDSIKVKTRDFGRRIQWKATAPRHENASKASFGNPVTGLVLSRIGLKFDHFRSERTSPG